MKKISVAFIAIGLLTGVSSVVSAQEQTIRKEVRIEMRDDNVNIRGDNFTPMFGFIADGGGFTDLKTVKNAPYSGEFTNESIQTFADGNRIVRRSSSKIFRDSEGRTRREQTLNHIGSLATNGEPSTLISINDSVSGFNYFINSNDKTARKMKTFTFGDGKMFGGKDFGAKGFDLKNMPPMPMRPEGREGFARPDRKPFGEPKVESLGTQNIAGVDAEGTRTTITVPAEAIGNERAFDIVHEVWKSKDLGIIVLSKHSDPMTGEQTYQATKIVKGEQDKSLFEVPADYKVSDSTNRDFRIMRRPQGLPPMNGQIETPILQLKKKQ